MHDADLHALVRQHFPAATQIIMLAAGDPGGMLFHDADPALQAAGIAATSYDAASGHLYLRRLPPPDALPPTPRPR